MRYAKALLARTWCLLTSTHERRMTSGFGLGGSLLGLKVGGMGLALLGTAIPLFGWLTFGILGALVGNVISRKVRWPRRVPPSPRA